MATEEEPVDLIDVLTNSIDSAVNQVDGGMTTKWVLVLETIDRDGDYGLWTVGARDTKPWDVLGLLDYARTVQKVKIASLEDEYEGEE